LTSLITRPALAVEAAAEVAVAGAWAAAASASAATAVARAAGMNRISDAFRNTRQNNASSYPDR
jgi:TPP-dependent indolepyruvate ferredoxin oxidoreductase alpha subunit